MSLMMMTMMTMMMMMMDFASSPEPRLHLISSFYGTYVPTFSMLCVMSLMEIGRLETLGLELNLGRQYIIAKQADA